MSDTKESIEHVDHIPHIERTTGTSRLTNAILEENPNPLRKSFLKLYGVVFVAYLCSATNGFDANTFGEYFPTLFSHQSYSYDCTQVACRPSAPSTRTSVSRQTIRVSSLPCMSSAMLQAASLPVRVQTNTDDASA